MQLDSNYLALLLETIHLSNIELHMDRGYSGEKQYLDALASFKADSTCSTARAKWVAYNFGKKEDNDTRQHVEESGIMSLQVSTKTVNGRQLACGAFNTGTGNVVLYMSTIFRDVKMDYVTKDRMGRLWNKDREKLKALGYVMEQSSCRMKSAEAKRTHAMYYDLLCNADVDQVTAFPNGKEFHLARRFSLTSKQTYALLLVLKRHYKDLDYDYIRVVFDFMYKNYNIEQRQQQKANDEQAANDAANNNNAESEITYTSNRTPEELMDIEPAEYTVEERVRMDIYKLCERK